MLGWLTNPGVATFVTAAGDLLLAITAGGAAVAAIRIAGKDRRTAAASHVRDREYEALYHASERIRATAPVAARLVDQRTMRRALLDWKYWIPDEEGFAATVLSASAAIAVVKDLLPEGSYDRMRTASVAVLQPGRRGSKAALQEYYEASQALLGFIDGRLRELRVS